MTTYTRLVGMWASELAASGASPATVDLRRSHLRRFARVCPRPDEASHDVLVAWLDHPRWMPETRKSARSSLVGFFTWAHRRGHVTTNPAADLPRVRVPEPRPRPASDEAIRAALAAANDRQWLLIMLCSTAGMRRGEVSRLNLADFTGTAVLVHGKAGKLRTLTLPAGLVRACRELADGDGWVFGNGRGQHLTSGHTGRVMRRVLPPGVSPHMLRHSAASALHDAGLSPFELRRLLGHASVRTTQIYIATNDERISNAIDRRADGFGGRLAS